MLLHANRLTGSIPRELGNLTELGNLILSQNRLTGQIPHTLARFEDTINPQQGDEYLPVETAVPALPILAALRRPVVHGAAADRTGRQIGMRIPTAGAGAHPPPGLDLSALEDEVQARHAARSRERRQPAALLTPCQAGASVPSASSGRGAARGSTTGGRATRDGS